MDLDTSNARLLIAVAIVVTFMTAFLGQHDRQLWAPDELREAGITRAMARTGDIVTPRLNGRAFLEKPPLFHAAGAAIHATGATGRFATRLPAAIFGIATVVATYALARRLGGARLGALSAAVLATSSGYFVGCHRAVTDCAIPPFVACSFLAIERACAHGATWRPFAWLGAALGAAFLAKGAVGPAIVVAGTLGYLAWLREWRRLADPRLLIAVMAALLPIGAWLLALYVREGPAAVRTILIDNNLQRAASGGADHANPWWYYGQHLPVYLLPWTPFAALGAAAVLAPARVGAALHGEAAPWQALRLPASWLFAGVALLSVASAKRPIYLLPLMPAGAILAAGVLEAIIFERRPTRLARPIVLGLGVLAFIAVAAAALATGFLRGDVGLALVGLVAAALLGHWTARAIREERPARLAACVLVAASLSFTMGFRAGAARGDEQRGAESFAAALAPFVERPVFVLQPPESVEGALTYFFDRDFPAARGAAALAPLLANAPSRPFVIVACDVRSEDRGALPDGRSVWQGRIGRTEIAILLYEPEAHISGPPAPSVPAPADSR